MLEALPDVPLILIFKYLSFEDQKNVRIVCRSLADRGIILSKSLKFWNIRSQFCHFLPEYEQIIANVNLLVSKCCRMKGCNFGKLHLKECRNVNIQWIRRHADRIVSLEYIGGQMTRQIEDNIRFEKLRQVKVENCSKNSRLASLLKKVCSSLETMIVHLCEFCRSAEMSWLSELTCTFPQLDKIGMEDCSVSHHLNQALSASFNKITTLVLYKVDIKLFSEIKEDLATVKYVSLIDCRGEEQGLPNLIKRCSSNLTSLVMKKVDLKILDSFDCYLPALKLLSLSKCNAANGQYVLLEKCAANLEVLDIDESFDMHMCSRITLPQLKGLYYKKLTRDHEVSGLNLMLGACHESLLVLGIYLGGPGKHSSEFSSITQELENLALFSTYPKPRSLVLKLLQSRVKPDTLFEHKLQSLQKWNDLEFDFDLKYTKTIKDVMNYGDFS